MDPDGRRGAKGRPWTDPITREEFEERRVWSALDAWSSAPTRKTTGGTMSRAMTSSEQNAYREFMSLAEHCRNKAREAIHKGSQVATREWLEAAKEATQAAAAIRTDVPE